MHALMGYKFNSEISYGISADEKHMEEDTYSIRTRTGKFFFCS